MKERKLPRYAQEAFAEERELLGLEREREGHSSKQEFLDLTVFSQAAGEYNSTSELSQKQIDIRVKWLKHQIDQATKREYVYPTEIIRYKSLFAQLASDHRFSEKDEKKYREELSKLKTSRWYDLRPKERAKRQADAISKEELMEELQQLHYLPQPEEPAFPTANSDKHKSIEERTKPLERLIQSKKQKLEDLSKEQELEDDFI